ncbi:MAG: hypothetical protein JWP59_3428 [Massilia sp.]|nr:hypothetical protein [Massilia sp.]
MSSYLFDEPTHLNDLHWRDGDRTEAFWTSPSVPGKRFGQRKAVYILTSARTFSAAEEFSYNLQQLRRATLIGEITRGGANPGRTHALNARFAVFVPDGRAVNPVSKTNWEGSGVKPDVIVPADQALKTALDMARKILRESKR